MTARQTRNITTITPPPTASGADAPTAIVQVRAGLMTRLGVAARVARAAESGHSHGERSAELRTNRLTLRPLRASDRDEFLRVLLLSREHLARFCPLEHADIGGDGATNDAVFARQLALSNAALETGRACRLAAFANDRAPRLVGAFNVNDVERGLECRGELVCWLSVDAHHNGYAEEGLRAIIAHALADLPRGLGLHRLVGLIAPDNRPSARLARKVGLSPCPRSGQVELVLGDRRIPHDVWNVFAGVKESPAATPNTGAHIVEGKPSMAEALFGRGLLSILRTETASSSPRFSSEDRVLSSVSDKVLTKPDQMLRAE